MCNEKEIPIVFAADNNYIIPLIVTIRSLLKYTNRNTKYSITILVDKLFNEDEFWHISNLREVNCVSFIKIDETQLSHAQINNEGLSIFTYCRLLIPELLPHIDRCLYLDTDIIVLDDLSEIYSTNIENAYIAGVKDYAIQNLLKKKVWDITPLEIDDESQYVNAGVLLLNLKKIREDKIDQLLLINVGKKWRLEDQDILNKCCYGKICFLELRYNIFYRFYKNVTYFEQGFYSKRELQEAEKYPAIIHYTGSKMKPWKNTRTRAAKLWWNVAKEVLPINTINELKKNAQIFEEGLRWNNIITQCCGKKVVIFGFSAIGCKVLGWLKNSNIEISYFCDNDINKRGTIFENVEVRMLEDILDKKDDYTFLIVSQNAAGEIRKQLLDKGIKDIITYYDKGEYYYMALDNEYYDEEIIEIQEKEKVREKEFTKELLDKFWMSEWVYKEKIARKGGVL